ncbi:hypothetical protein OY671_009056, partial [Metschnikowia pulcherrima]
ERAVRSLDAEPEAASTSADAVSKNAPGLSPAEMIACQASRRSGNAGAASPRLAASARRHPGAPPVSWEWAQAASEAGDVRQAIAALESLTRQQPGVASGWFSSAVELRKDGRHEDGWRADLSGIHAASRDPESVQAAMAMNEGQLEDAAAASKARSERLPDDPVGTRSSGEVAWRRADMAEAMTLVRRASDLAPGFDSARDFSIRSSSQTNRSPEALEHAEVSARSPVNNP